MDLEELKETSIWELFERGRNYNRMFNMYTDTDKNYRMYNGDQWYGVKVKGIEPIQLNIIKPIVKYKVGTINSNYYLPVFSAENFDNNEFKDVAIKTCELLNKLASKVWEKDSMDYKTRAISKHSAINDECPVYVTYDSETNLPVNEILSKNDVYYGNENDSDIQNQPYILIKQRKPVINIIEMARKEGVNEKKLEYIISDNDTTEEAGDSAKKEIDNMCTLVTKLYKKDGTVHFSQATRWCDIKEDKDTGLKLYPLTHMLWEEKEGSARGEGEVRFLIPNQLEINKTLMRRLLSAKTTAYPQKIVDVSKIINPSAIDTVGGTIKTNGQTVDDVRKIMGVISPAQMSTDVEKVMTELISTTRELAGAGDIATGDVNPESASGKAILAVQQASQMPVTEQTLALKTTLEDLARIWLDMWKTYATDGLIIDYETIDSLTREKQTQPVKVQASVLQELQASVKVDITPKSPFDKFAQELSLENMLKAGYFNVQKLSELEVYVELLDDDSSMPKSKLEEAIKRMKETQQRIQQIQSQAQALQMKANQYLGTQQDITSIGQYGNEMFNQAMTMGGGQTQTAQ